VNEENGDVRVARWVATIAGLLGFLLALATPSMSMLAPAVNTAAPPQTSVRRAPA